MNKTLKIISSLVVLISITVIFMFKTVPVGKLWNDYSILYVPIETSDEEILDTFKITNINDVVALSQQYLPLNISEDSLEYSMYKVNIDSNNNQYIKNRTSYFFDKSQQYRIYYIPKEYDHKLNKAISILESKHISCGLDANAGYPILFPTVVLILTIGICIFAKNKFLFSISASIPVLYAFCNPFFPVALSISLLILCLFFISNIWKRKGAFSYIKNIFFIPATLIIALLCSFSSSLKSGLMFIIAIVGSIAVLYTYNWIENYISNKKSFIPVNIRSAKQVSIFSNKANPVYLFFGIGTLLMLGIFFLTSTGTFSNNTSKVQLPSSSSIESTDLPQLNDYFDWAWNVETYPYRSLNSNNISNSVIYPTYSSENGFITEKDLLLEYDEDFKINIYDNINQLQFNSIEKVMKSEGKDFKGGYNSSSSYHIDLFGIILIIICYLILLFIYFSIIITKKGTAK